MGRWLLLASWWMVCPANTFSRMSLIQSTETGDDCGRMNAGGASRMWAEA